VFLSMVDIPTQVRLPGELFNSAEKATASGDVASP